MDGEGAAAKGALARRVADLETAPPLVVQRVLVERHGEELLLARNRRHEDAARREEGLEAVAAGRVEAARGRATGFGFMVHVIRTPKSTDSTPHVMSLMTL